MIKLKNENLINAVEGHSYSKAKIAAFADSSPATLEKLLSGDTEMNLSSVERIAAFLGFDVEVQFVQKAPDLAVAK